MKVKEQRDSILKEEHMQDYCTTQETNMAALAVKTKIQPELSQHAKALKLVFI